MNIYHEQIPLAYVYKITNKETTEFYIGSRINSRTMFKFTPEQDIGYKYFSSGKWKNLIKADPLAFNIEIIFRSNEHIINPINNKKEYIAYWYEQLIIKAEKHNKLCINGYYIEPDSFSKCYRSQIGKAKGMFTVIDRFGSHHWISRDNPSFISGEYTALSSGRTSVKDKFGAMSSIPTTDNRLETGELVGATKGTTVIKDTNGEMFRVSLNDPRLLSGEYIPFNKGIKHKETKCPHCNKIGSGPNMTRYHFDNCQVFTGNKIITKNQFS